MRLSVIIVSWNVVGLLRQCLLSLQAEIKDLKAEVFVVDNASMDSSVSMVKQEFPWVSLIANNKNLGFAAANNQALKRARGDYLLLLNPDTEITGGAIKNLLRFLEENPRCGVVAPQLLNSDGSIQRSCRAFPTFLGMFYELMGFSRIFPQHNAFGNYKMLGFDHCQTRQVDQPEGACLMLRRQVVDEVGMLDEGFFMLFEEVDWCYRIKKAGWQVWFLSEAKVIHHYGQSIKQVKIKMILSSHRGLYRFWSKHYSKGRWYLFLPIYCGLMILAYVRIASYSLRSIVYR